MLLPVTVADATPELDDRLFEHRHRNVCVGSSHIAGPAM